MNGRVLYIYIYDTWMDGPNIIYPDMILGPSIQGMISPSPVYLS